MTAWTKWLQSRPLEWLQSSAFESLLPKQTADLEDVRQQVLSLIDDCKGTECERLRWRLHTAESAQDLWLLRGPLFQLLANQHCQSQAAERVNGLVPAFQELLPPRMVSRV